MEITKQQIPVLAARLVEFQEKFGQLSKEDGQYVIQRTAEAIDLFVEALKNRKLAIGFSILRPISKDGGPVLKALDGKLHIYQARNIFNAYLDPDFEQESLVNSGIATPSTPVDVNEIVEDAKLKEFFIALPGNWNQKWFSQNQVIEFCREHYGWLGRNRKQNFFLIKKDENKPIDEDNPDNDLFVVFVSFQNNDRELKVQFSPLDLHVPLDSKYHHRVFSPRIKKVEMR